MKICLPSTGPSLNSFLDFHFGRAEFFLIVDEKGNLIKAIKNPGVQALRGAGTTAAQIVIEEKVDTLITGNIGPNAYMVFRNVGIKVFLGKGGMKIEEVLRDYQEGKLSELTEPTFFSPGFRHRHRRRHRRRGWGKI